MFSTAAAMLVSFGMSFISFSPTSNPLMRVLFAQLSWLGWGVGSCTERGIEVGSVASLTHSLTQHYVLHHIRLASWQRQGKQYARQQRDRSQPVPTGLLLASSVPTSLRSALSWASVLRISTPIGSLASSSSSWCCISSWCSTAPLHVIFLTPTPLRITTTDTLPNTIISGDGDCSLQDGEV